MEFTEYIKIKKRMTNMDETGHCGIACCDCELFSVNNGTPYWCYDLQDVYPEKAEAIVKKWAEEHPQKTILQDFFEKYPNATIGYDDSPFVCVADLGYIVRCNPEISCVDCWNQSLDELEE